MTKSALLALIGGIVVAAAITLNFVLDDADDAPPPSKEKVSQSADQAKPKPAVKAKVEAPKIGAPSFDIVRINPQGDTVMAGRAMPGAKVEIYDGDTKIGEVTADKRGEWVFVPTTPLKPGSHQLSLRMIGPDGKSIPSESNVVLVVPEKGKDIAGRQTKDPTQPLAMKVPRKGGGGVQVLQKPSPEVTIKQAAKRSGESESDLVALSVDAIDYDEDGKLDVTGKAPPGATIHTYIDNHFFGRSTTGAKGLWVQSPDRKVKPGVYTLRADQVDKDGKVLARIEVVFARSVPLTGVKPGSLVVVESGNSLWRIARRTYGTGFRYTVIYEANKEQIGNPDLIFPGQVFSLPTMK